MTDNSPLADRSEVGAAGDPHPTREALAEAWARALGDWASARSAAERAESEAARAREGEAAAKRRAFELERRLAEVSRRIEADEVEIGRLRDELAALRGSLWSRLGGALSAAGRAIGRTLPARRTETVAPPRSYGHRSGYAGRAFWGAAEAQATIVLLDSSTGFCDPEAVIAPFRDAAAAGRLDLVVATAAPVVEVTGVRHAPLEADVDPADHLDRIVRRARGRFVVVLSEEGRFDPDGIDAFDEVFANDPRVALALGLVTFAGRVAWAGAAIDDGHRAFRSLLADLERDDDRVMRTIDPEFPVPGCIAFERSAYSTVGGLSLGHGGLAGSIVDFGRRLRETGLSMRTTPFARLDLLAPPSDPPERSVVSPELAGWHASLATIFNRPRPRVLVLDSVAPTPERDSGSNDLLWTIRLFVDFGWDVTFVPVHEREHAGVATDRLRKLGVRSPVTPRLDEPAEFIAREGRTFDLIVLRRITVADGLLAVCRTAAPAARIVFDTVDLHFLRQMREAELTGSAADRAEAERLRERELVAARAADATLVVGRQEEALLAALAPDVRCRVTAIGRPVPGRLAPLGGRAGAFFVGGFRHRPNVDAVRFLVRDIWPLVRAERPDATLAIVGADPPEDVLSLVDPTAGIEVLGHVADLAPLYARFRVALAPLRFGAGVKGKVVAAMAAGVPTVGTTIAAEGMDLVDGRTILIADEPAAFADRVCRLLADDALWSSMSDAGIETAALNWSVEAAAARLRALLGELGLPG